MVVEPKQKRAKPPPLEEEQKPKKSDMKKKKKRTFFEQAEGWKAFELPDDFLLGAEEGGFAGLEVLDDPLIIQQTLKSYGVQEDAAGAASKGSKAQKKAAAKAATSAAEPSGGSGDEDVVALQQRIKALEAENNQLKAKKQKVGSGSAAAAQKEGGSKGAVAAAAPAAPSEKKKLQLEKREALKQKRKEKKQQAKEEKRKKKEAEAAAAGGASEQQQAAAAAAAAAVDMSAWSPYNLHPLVLRALALQGFSTPTEVQQVCLPAAVRDRLDIIGAAQTGSGKTLAFGLPIMQLLAAERERTKAKDGGDDDAGQEVEGGDKAAAAASSSGRSGGMRALVLAPTRELALQVTSHLQAIGRVCGVHVTSVVGGLAQVKQERRLARRPEVVVATPGRLWELMRSGTSHLCDMSALSFLVLDEADRMVQQGHYQELSEILDRVPRPDSAAAAAAAGGGGGGGGGVAAVEEEPEEEEDDDEEEPEEEGEEEEDDGVDEDGGSRKPPQLRRGKMEAAEAEAASQQQGAAPRKRQLLQTFVFSATLTLPEAERQRLRKGQGGATGSGTFEALMDRMVFRGKPKVVDLTTKRRIAERVEEAQLECLDDERDAFLYYLLAHHPGRTVVFVNAVSAVRRVAALLKLLGLPAMPLHAQQQQKQRLRALDRFKSMPQGVLVATDVAARGLDVRGVHCVIHYQLPATADTYIHRCGRTGRASADGISISLVTPKESARFGALCNVLGRPPPVAFPVDLTLLPEVKRRLKLAIKIDEAQRLERKEQAEKNWFRKNAEEAELDYSDDDDGGGCLDEESQRPGERQREVQSAQVARLVAELNGRLAAPLQPKINPRFFAGNLSAELVRAAAVAKAPAPGAAGGGNAPRASVDPAVTVVSKAVELAGRLQASKQQQQPASKPRGSGGSGEGADKQQQQQQQATGFKKPPQQQQHQKQRGAAAEKQNGKKPAPPVSRNQMKKQRRGGLTVIPPAFGRDAAAPDALAVLRQRLGQLSSSTAGPRS